MKTLNAAVTLAIFEAEHADARAATFWDKVAECEQAILDTTDPAFTEYEKSIAERGVQTAKERARLLRREKTPIEELAALPCQSVLRFLPDCSCDPCDARRQLEVAPEESG